jgi:WD40 repeat protein
MSFHPTESKPLIFAGDKMGNLGILDASQTPSSSGNVTSGRGEADTEEGEDPDPVITTIKPHARTVSSMHLHPSTPSKLYTASYDSSIRALDLERSVSVEVYAPPSTSDDYPLSAVDMAPDNPHVLYFTTLEGFLGRHDMRIAAKTGSKSGADLYQLAEKKIGGFSLYPSEPRYIATASLDRFVRVWDLRELSKRNPTPVAEHESTLSVSHAAFNSVGQIATSSYDNSIKVYEFGARSSGFKQLDHTISTTEMAPDTVIRHNCQTGRWVTMYV